MFSTTVDVRTFNLLSTRLLGGQNRVTGPPKILKILVCVSLYLLILSGFFDVFHLPTCTPDRRDVLSRYALVARLVTPLFALNGSLAARFAWGPAASPRRVVLAFRLRERQIANSSSLVDISLNVR